MDGDDGKELGRGEGRTGCVESSACGLADFET